MLLRNTSEVVFFCILLRSEDRAVLLYESTNHPWDAQDLFRDLTPADIRLTPAAKAECQGQMWDDMCSEFDAENLCLELERQAHAGQIYSPELWSFEQVWRRDEYNHYAGFRRLYFLMYGVAEADLDQQMRARPADFSHFGEFLTDEFKLCLMLAYDELCTTRSYATDVPFYRSLGPAACATWIERLRADEALHYKNALHVAMARYPDRLAEAPAIINHIVTLDLNSRSYQNTFILDHHGPSYTPDLLNGAAQTVIAVIARRQA